MLINNRHEREINCSIEKASLLIDTFAEPNALLWPSVIWPREPFDGPLQIGAIGSHGGTSYRVEVYQPGKILTFRFISPNGYQGTHGYELTSIVERRSVMVKHFTQLEITGKDLFWWKFAIRWVHDALIEDAFSKAEHHLTGQIKKPYPWLWRVYFLRHFLGGSRLICLFFKNFISKKEKK